MYAKARRRHQAYFSITLCLFHGISLSLNEPGLAFSLGWNLSSTRHPPVSALSELEGADLPCQSWKVLTPSHHTLLCLCSGGHSCSMC